MTTVEIKKIHTLTGHKDCLYALTALNDHQFISGGGDGMIVQWDLKDPETGQLLVQLPTSTYALAFEPTRGLLVVGQNMDGIRLIDVKSKKEVSSISLTKAAIFDICVSDQLIWVGDGNGVIFQLDWDLNILHKLKASSKSVRSLNLSPDRRNLVAGFSDNYIRIYESAGMNHDQEMEAHKISVFAVRYHPEAAYLISGSRDAHFRVWNCTKDYELVEEVPAHMYAINDIDFSPNGQHFVTCSMDKTIKVWDSKSFKLLKVIDKARHEGHLTSVNKLLWMDFDNLLISCSDDRTISIWDINFVE